MQSCLKCLARYPNGILTDRASLEGLPLGMLLLYAVLNLYFIKPQLVYYMSRAVPKLSEVFRRPKTPGSGVDLVLECWVTVQSFCTFFSPWSFRRQIFRVII
ncbi:hypothetical protein CPC08DRAFT_525732 [Agrocybe pediades]|nr:hypothetical protein CPC08DRAFT_525732 [Agrocybe pediades]